MTTQSASSGWWARFTFNGITRYDQGAYGLVGGEELSDAERDQLLELCRQRLDASRMQRGEEVGCLLTQKPAASGTGAATARRSAARSTSGCSPVPRAAANAAAPAVAQQTQHQRALEVDPIVPRNQGDSDDLSNLQALCFRCNAGRQALVPQTFFELLQPLLTERHSPISTSTGQGNQVVYLAGLSETLGLMLLKLIEDHADPAVRVHLVVLAEEGAYTAAITAVS